MYYKVDNKIASKSTFNVVKGNIWKTSIQAQKVIVKLLLQTTFVTLNYSSNLILVLERAMVTVVVSFVFEGLQKAKFSTILIKSYVLLSHLIRIIHAKLLKSQIIGNFHFEAFTCTLIFRVLWCIY